MLKRHTTAYVEKVNIIKHCDKPIYQFILSGAYEVPFAIEPTEGEHDFNTCKGCQENLVILIKRFTEKLNGHEDQIAFPNCCTGHKNLAKLDEFDRTAFANTPEITARKIIYTVQHVCNFYNAEDWYKRITDYIEWTITSFGQTPNDCGEPLFLSHYFKHVNHLIKQHTEIPPERLSKILAFIESYQNPSLTVQNDMATLIEIYQQWLKIFPFDLSYFSALKERFEKQLPFLNGKPNKNMYSNYVTATLRTKESLFEVLLNSTNKLLTEINGLTQYQKGLITDTDKIKLELLISSRQLKLNEGYKHHSPDEKMRYRKMIKKWFNDERKFINDLAPILKSLPPRAPDKTDGKKEKRNYISLAFYYYYMQTVKELEWFDNWIGGRETAYKEVTAKHFSNPAKTAWKQFQTEYAKVEKEHSANRWQHCSKENYYLVMELLRDNPKALAKAKEELNKAIE